MMETIDKKLLERIIYGVLQKCSRKDRYKVVAALFPTYSDITRLAEHIAESHSATPALLSGVSDSQIAQYLRKKGYSIYKK